MERRCDFKLGVIHGRIKAQRQELIMQRNLFLTGNIIIKSTKDAEPNQRIRIFGYEVPLGCYRDKCIDLLGYDKTTSLYIIELKGSESSEKLPEVEKQITGYANEISIESLEEDFYRTFYTKIEFQGTVEKAILAPRKFYRKNGVGCKTKPGIKYLYFKDSDSERLQNNDFDKVRLNRPVQVHEWARKMK